MYICSNPNCFRRVMHITTRISVVIVIVFIVVQTLVGSRLSFSEEVEAEVLIERLQIEAKEFRKSRNFRKALSTLDSALSICISIESPLLKSNILTQKGIVAMYTSDYSKALRFIQDGLVLRQKLPYPDKLAESYNYIAAVHQIQGNHQIAADYYRLSLALVKKSGSMEELGKVTNNLGSLYEDLANYTEALNYHKESLEIWQSLNDSSWISVSLRHLGQCYRSTGELRKALVALERSYNMNKRFGSVHNTIYSAQTIGLVHMDLNNFSEALEWLTLSYNLSVEENNLLKIQESSSSLARVYEKLGVYEKALSFYRTSEALKDSVFGKEMTREITELEMGFQFEKEQLKDSLEYVRTTLIQDKKISNQRIGLVSIGIITIIMLLLALVVYQGKQKSDGLLLNILPKKVADELKKTGRSKATKFDDVTVIFTDFKGFTELSEILSAEELVAEIDQCFSAFDAIMTKYGIEKIKTIGDAYMAASGLPEAKGTHAIDAVNAALEMIDFMSSRKKLLDEQGGLGFEMRVGLNSGSVVAGIVGTKKFQYDIWGDTVNIAARMESSGESGKLNVSAETYELIKNHFDCQYRGKIKVKGKGEMEMYFVEAKS